jgi:hypothetical protein
LLEQKSTRFTINTPGKVPLLSRADFNCPGGGIMMLDGKSSKKDLELDPSGEVHLDKSGHPQFEDDWDFIIDNYTVGGNDPYLIDSINRLQYLSVTPNIPPAKEIPSKEVVKSPPPVITKPPKSENPPPVIVKAPPVSTPSIEEKFITRKKVLTKEIPVSGDSIELRFYDNAEVDGDSISLFLNGKLLFEHIRLTAAAYSIKLSLADLDTSNELIMVAENLGSIPPNTSYMLAIVGDKRYDAYLSSTEGSSAMIRFVKTKSIP